MEWMIELLDEDGIARDSDGDFYASREAAKDAAKAIVRDTEWPYQWVYGYRLVSFNEDC